MLDQWKILKQIFLLKNVLTEEGESFSTGFQHQELPKRKYEEG